MRRPRVVREVRNAARGFTGTEAVVRTVPASITLPLFLRAQLTQEVARVCLAFASKPNRAGEVWPIGSSKTLRWTSNLGTLEPVEIRLSRNGGLTYPIVIVATTPADGAHTLTVPAAWGTQTTTRVRVTWLKTPSVAAVSPAFTIQP